MAQTATQSLVYNLVLQPTPRKLFQGLACKTLKKRNQEDLFIMDEDVEEEQEQDCLASATMELHEILRNPNQNACSRLKRN
jgi:hypothetical protein